MEIVDPYDDKTRYGLEFRIQFFESGSFFVQIAYEDALSGKIKYTQA
jgi:hypothetical protein